MRLSHDRYPEPASLESAPTQPETVSGGLNAGYVQVGVKTGLTGFRGSAAKAAFHPVNDASAATRPISVVEASFASPQSGHQTASAIPENCHVHSGVGDDQAPYDLFSPMTILQTAAKERIPLTSMARGEARHSRIITAVILKRSTTEKHISRHHTGHICPIILSSLRQRVGGRR